MTVENGVFFDSIPMESPTASSLNSNAHISLYDMTDEAEREHEHEQAILHLRRRCTEWKKRAVNLELRLMRTWRTLGLTE